MLVIGGGLAGTEAAWQLAQRGIRVRLAEMRRGGGGTPAHRTDLLAELVCSNSFKSLDLATGHGLLKAEMGILGSLCLRIAEKVTIPAGSSLAVDRERFAALVTEAITAHPLIRCLGEEITDLREDVPTIVATGPLTSDALSEAIRRVIGGQDLYFYDAIAPIVASDSIDLSRTYRCSRYGKGGDDYINCPLTGEEYERFHRALVSGEVVRPHPFEKEIFFQACLPIEEIARRGRDAPRFGPMRPVGLPDPATGREPYAVVQLRQDDLQGEMQHLVGFQTRLTYPEQERIFRQIPALREARFLRHGSVHRNTFLNSPRLLTPYQTLRAQPERPLFFSGQLTGVEGYVESMVSGMLAGANLARRLQGKESLVPPPSTMVGALGRYVSASDPDHFQPMNANFGLLPPAPRGGPRRRRREGLVRGALRDMQEWAEAAGFRADPPL